MENAVEIFKSAGVRIDLDNVRANRKQLMSIYEVPRKTLADNIKDLKEDNLISGAKIRHTATDGKKYMVEVYDIEEIISIGFRLRSDRAILFQKWARSVIKEKLRQQQILAERAWDVSDKYDLVRTWK